MCARKCVCDCFVLFVVWLHGAHKVNPTPTLFTQHPASAAAARAHQTQQSRSAAPSSIKDALAAIAGLNSIVLPTPSGSPPCSVAAERRHSSVNNNPSAPAAACCRWDQRKSLAEFPVPAAAASSSSTRLLHIITLQTPTTANGRDDGRQWQRNKHTVQMCRVSVVLSLPSTTNILQHILALELSI